MTALRSAVLLGLALLAPGLGVPRAADEAPLTVEDVVRAHVGGARADELIARIRAAQVDFDLSEPMLDELRRARLPEPVIGAMLERQRELHPPPPDDPSSAADAEADAASNRLIVHPRLGPPERPAPALRVAAAAPPDLLARLHIDDPAARIEELALYVACLTATHVPDHWRMESPLGRDFEGTPRHRMLAFVAGSRLVDGESRLELSLPETLEAPLGAEGPHELVAGIAVRIAGRFYTASHSEPLALVAEPPAALDVRITSAGADPRTIDLVLQPAAATD